MPKQHLISRVLLRQFAGSNGDLLSFDLRFGADRPRNPTAVGWRSDFIEHDARASELVWAAVENRLGDAIASLSDGPPYTHAHLATLKSAVALHFMRRERTKSTWNASVHRRLFDGALEERIASLLPKERVPAALAKIKSEVLSDSPEWFQENVESLYKRADDFAAKQGIEVFRAIEGEFLIGDNPVLSARRDGGAGAPAFIEASTHVLPVAPEFAVALGPRDLWADASADVVDQLNRQQIGQATSHVFLRPGQPLLDFVKNENVRASESN